jgi:F0F1-type ATP synthase epsilon subunit
MAAKKDNDQEQDSTPGNDPTALMAALTSAIERLNEKIATSPAPAAGGDQTALALIAVLAPALERLADAQLAGAKLQADETRRAHRPSNEFTHRRSVFNRRGETLEGYTKPKLRCKTMLPWEVENESITREECELINLLEPGEYRVKRIDNSKIVVTVQVRYGVDQVTPSVVLMNSDTAFSNDNKNLMPGLADLMRQILKQHKPEIAAKAAAIMTDEEEEALIEAGELTVSV